MKWLYCRQESWVAGQWNGNLQQSQTNRSESRCDGDSQDRVRFFRCLKEMSELIQLSYSSEWVRVFSGVTDIRRQWCVFSKWILNCSHLLSEDNKDRNLCVCALDIVKSEHSAEWIHELLYMWLLSVCIKSVFFCYSQMFRTRWIVALYRLWSFESALILRIVVIKMDGALPHYALVEPELEQRCITDP